ncbi:ogr/Delta-like zinc finger family protein [Providencia alcalifaciens]|uniref:ogr/Delta-like zinc finger family protein n=1 Tax=Providencia TaxID=586 RepID=UPI00234AA836|nr:ogr/Delta-like zinc finger family protein [Providencia sp. PROV209]EIL1982747.1 ogr/Delta-like zinc finger family protein [Providencia rettgeri]
MMKCPLCGELARIRTSRYITNETKENHNQCQNVNCSATFISHESVSRFIVKPNKVNSVDLCAGAV